MITAALLAQGCASRARDDVKTGSVGVPTAASPESSKSIAPENAVPVSLPARDLSKGVSLVDAVNTTISRHPAVAESLGRIREQEQMIAEARAGYKPRLSGGVRTEIDNSIEGQWRPAVYVSASQMVYDFGKLKSQIAAETAEKRGRHADLVGTIDDLGREAASAVVEIDRYNQLAVVAREHVRDNRSILKLVVSRTDEGASTKSDRLQAEARVQSAEAKLLEVQSQARRWQSTLSALSGLPAPIKVQLTTPARLADACAATSPDGSKVGAILKADAEISEADARMKRSRADIFPTISLEGSVDADVRDPGRQPDYKVGLKASASLYDGGVMTARKNAASFAAASAQAAKARTLLETTRSLTESGQQIGGLQQQEALMVGRERTMKETRDLYEIQYRDLGTRTLLDLLNAADEFHGNRFQRVNISHDIVNLKIECAFFSGAIREVFSISDTNI